MNKILAAVFLIGLSTEAVASEKIVFVKDSELFQLTNQDQLRQITHDGLAKELPVWSKDGSKIAAVAAVDPAVAQDQILIYDRSGVILSKLLIHPASEGIAVGMRSVESLQWISDTRIAASGSINPSTDEILIFDIKTQKLVAGFGADIWNPAYRPAYSSDGKHFAFEDGMPHFSSEAEWLPTLKVDDKAIFPAKGVHIEFASPLHWLGDGKSLIVVAQDYATKKKELVTYNISDGKVSTIPLDVPGDDKTNLFWHSGQFYITSDHKAWTYQQGSKQLTSVAPSLAVDPSIQEKAAQRHVNELVDKHGGREGNAWCDDCVFASMPREATDQ